ncbi:MAG: glycosyltransferase family 4 protein [Candidatus Thermoplasmatota archaeon]|nr:glycosyltransferase family 4 protein [Candidatus Thermoplasmatota archaeon]
MKILLFNTGPSMSGVGVFVESFVNKLSAEVDIVNLSWSSNSGNRFSYPESPSGSTTLVSSNRSSLVISLPAIFIGSFTKKVNDHIANSGTKYDLVMASSHDSAFLVPVAQKLFECSSCVMVHDVGYFRSKLNPLWLFNRFNLHALDHIDRLICASKNTLISLTRKHPSLAKKAMVIEEPFDSSLFKYRDKYYARELLKLPSNKKIILSIGNDWYVKNIRSLLLSLKFLPFEDFVLVRVGNFALSRSTFDKLPQFIKSKVLLISRQPRDKIPLFFNAADVFCFPSIYEGFGMELVEAALSGTQIVTTNAEPMRDLVGDLAILVHNPCNPVEIADAIQKALRSDKRKLTSEEIQSKLNQRFGIQRFVSEFERMFKEIEHQREGQK